MERDEVSPGEILPKLQTAVPQIRRIPSSLPNCISAEARGKPQHGRSRHTTAAHSRDAEQHQRHPEASHPRPRYEEQPDKSRRPPGGYLHQLPLECPRSPDCAAPSALLFLLARLAICTRSNGPITVKTVLRGATVTEPVLNVSTLDIHDQVMTYHEGKLCAEYFCDNGTCHNHPTLVSRFQVNSGDLCLIIPNVNISNSGQYGVLLNGYKNVMTLILHVEEVPEQSFLIWLIPVIAVAVFVLIVVIVFTYKNSGSGFQKTETAPDVELHNQL
ncbi:uncharacterized protein [Pseudorasbora parva]|uniref:uncharacterized protein n=1 Tax=Pseudorasbora parva TaxID=51549 RepID=UPI00351F1823